MVEVTVIIAFLGGLISFFSPCIVPLIPAYLTNISGTTIQELKLDRSKQFQIFKNSIFFVLGFTVVFIILGLLIAGAFGQITGARMLLSRIGGVVIILFGLQTLGLLEIPILSTEHKIKANVEKKGYLSSSVLGAAFGIGWTPCVSGILASIFVIAGTSSSTGIGAGLLTAYAIGLGIPFLLVGAFTARASTLIQKWSRYLGTVNIISGILLIILGIIVFTDNFQGFIGFFAPLLYLMD